MDLDHVSEMTPAPPKRPKSVPSGSDQLERAAEAISAVRVDSIGQPDQQGLIDNIMELLKLEPSTADLNSSPDHSEGDNEPEELDTSSYPTLSDTDDGETGDLNRSPGHSGGDNESEDLDAISYPTLSDTDDGETGDLNRSPGHSGGDNEPEDLDTSNGPAVSYTDERKTGDADFPDGESLPQYTTQQARVLSDALGVYDEVIDANGKDLDKTDLGSAIITVNNEQYHMNHYFGVHWDQKIRDLDEVEPIKKLDNLTCIPHIWQLKGAAQAHKACLSENRGIIVGDAMGLGKTLLAIIAMYLAKDEHGSFSLVVCPKSVQRQWLTEIEENFKPGTGLNAFLLDDPSITAHELLAGGYDVVITSYEFVDSSLRTIEKYLNRMNNEDRDENEKLPVRPTSALHSEMWREMNLPIKRLVLDEVQKIKNDKGSRHTAVKTLFFHSSILMSGTFLDNKWTDVYGLLAILQGHPFDSKAKFLTAFSTTDYSGKRSEPEEYKIRQLQKLLLAYVIARPSSLLQLRDCERTMVLHDIKEDDSISVRFHVEKFFKAVHAALDRKKDSNQLGGEGLGGIGDNPFGSPLGNAIVAQLWSLHPVLVPPKLRMGADSDGGDIDILAELDPDADYVPGEEETMGAIIATNNEMPGWAGETRDEWLAYLDKEDIVYDSGRVVAFLELWSILRKEYPREKIIVFSAYLKFLDIIATALRKSHNIEALRYDGTMNSRKRELARSAFQASSPAVPMLITAGAGGVGLNMVDASIVIQTEPWWNHNSERQAYARVYRQGQQKTSKIYRLVASNSYIDHAIMAVQRKKTAINTRLMVPILRSWDQPAVIPIVPDTRPEAVINP